MWSTESKWVRRDVRSSAELRLICLPYGGGGASAFQHLPPLIPDEVELLAVQMPGREDRFWDGAPASVELLARTCAVALRPYCARPFAIYGHCAGALLGYELACELGQRYGLWPRHLIVGAQAAPHLPGPEPRLADLEDDAVVDVLRAWGGLSPAVEQDPELLRFLLPMLRADFELWQDYTPRHRTALPCDLTTLRGIGDPSVGPDLAAGWLEYTAQTYTDRQVAGGHFFITERPEASAAALADVLCGG